MSKFLVTGGAGFIGSHIVERLLKGRNYVRVLDNFSSGKLENLKPFIKRIDLIKGDITNAKTCLKAACGMDFILHQAALRSVPKSMSVPGDYNRVNIDGTLNMLQAARACKIKRFVLASSSSVYGMVEKFPEDENFLPGPVSPYALSKLTGEHYCRIFAEHFGVPAIALRYFNVFGPRQSLDDEYAVVIPKFINCLLKDQPLPIYGNGRQSRDFTFISNVVDANLLAARSPLKFGVFNVASGKDYTILSLIKHLSLILGKQPKKSFLPKRAGDVLKSLANLRHSRSALGYHPRFDFIKGLKITVDFWKKHV
ncbi:MAG: NAD-dependent epimerase/dehydratase family protein [Candidatus Omnitrophica bacterium]|jgi:nucleoside-diphosphate-sugar epimerase|nr:NAD-dependent epimerase/dehydratase family protein [Candidatus Omnitrophota bacterium]